MKQYFEEMIKESKQLTGDIINQMTQARIDKMPRLSITEDNVKPRSVYGTLMEVGDTVLYFVEDMGKSVHMRSVLLKEVDRLENDYTYVSMDGKCPRLKKK